MVEIALHNIEKNFGFKPVLKGASLELMTGDRAAIVGRNGSGKTTLFRLITGEEAPDKGSVSIRRGATIGYLEQIPTLADSAATARQVLTEPFAAAMAAEAELRRLEAAMATETGPEALQGLMDAYTGAQNTFAALDGYAMEEEFGRVVTGFGLEPLLDRPFNVLSGGQKTIVKLASTLLRRPDVLLLDEPTNHLDVKTLEWFEGFLSRYRGTVAIISHDRYFLDKVATRTFILDGGVAEEYKGNYSFAVAEQERLMLIEFEHYKTQQRKIEAMQAAIKRFREWGAQGDNPKFFRKANELEKRLEKLELIDRPQLEAKAIPIAFGGTRSGKEVLRLEDFSLTLAGLPLFSHAGLLVLEKERVALMGDNGTGKTTLIRCILGRQAGYTGKLAVNPSARIGYIPQEIRFEREADTVLEAFRRAWPCPELAARNILARYFFYGDAVRKRVSALSGGEKVLLKLAALLQEQINFLVLDEPTNHIDIGLREMLEQALLDFAGTVLFVSHDRYFINLLASRIVLLEGGTLHSFAGNYDDFRAARSGG